MSSKKYLNSPLPTFSEATEHLKGYPCFDAIPELLFDRIAEIAIAQQVPLTCARDRISQVIWEDQVRNSLSHLTEDEQRELAVAIKREVRALLEARFPNKPDTEEVNDQTSVLN